MKTSTFWERLRNPREKVAEALKEVRILIADLEEEQLKEDDPNSCEWEIEGLTNMARLLELSARFMQTQGEGQAEEIENPSWEWNEADIAREFYTYDKDYYGVDYSAFNLQKDGFPEFGLAFYPVKPRSKEELRSQILFILDYILNYPPNEDFYAAIRIEFDNERQFNQTASFWEISHDPKFKERLTNKKAKEELERLKRQEEARQEAEKKAGEKEEKR